MAKHDSLSAFRAKVREAVRAYVKTEGCGCCGDYEGHRKARNVLGKLLRFPKYSDGSGYDLHQRKPGA